jgi:glycosyltransferase involved in cell wall biosynthesis
MPDLSILMPVFNERATVVDAIDGVLEAELPVGDFELVIVDDGSTDGTSEVLDEGSWPENVKIIHAERNQGKGAAIRTALEHATGTWSTIMDADLEYDPADLTPVLEPLIEGKAQAVFGTRAFEAHTAYSFWYVVGNKGVTFAANVLYNRWLSDIMTCHKAMSTELFQSLRLRENGFAIEPEITAELLLKGVQIYEVPIVYRARSRELGKKLTATDGFRVLRTLLRCRIAPRSGR